ncbi:MAG: HD domain-containing protein [Anaerolineales bacterium]|nr:HD domain-containing protein [Anaerolineales bacterium]
MEYHDEVYGSVTIQEPVLLDLMASTAMQRLKGVMQHGITGLIGITQPVSRFEHSVGVMLLVCRLGATIKEQIAALLHDVSHTAFSHVIDYVFDNHDGQSYHDEHKEEFVIQTDLPKLLAKYGYHWRDFLEEDDFQILEQPAPRLCADRLDYFLRDSQELKLATEKDIEFVLQHLVVVNGRIATTNLQAARWLGYTFIAADDASWSNFREVGLYEITAQAIKRGLQIGTLSTDDIWGTDKPMWAKLQANQDPILQGWLQLITPQTKFMWDAENPTFRVSTKLRAIDPDVVIEGQLQPLSMIDADFANRRTDYLTRKSGKWPMRVIV